MKRLAPTILAVGIFMIAGCATLQVPPPPAPNVYALSPATSGVLADVSSKFAETHGADQSGILLLAPNDEALRWRLALIDHATKTIDAQYFIWQNDEIGVLLFDRLLKAADRGVRVRLLVDDLLFAAKDRNIAVIARHPNFDIKIFNPGKIRDSTVLGLGEFLLYFRELNRRMHNKLLVADNHLAIIGGRNIGNEYFGLSAKYNFRDLDVMVVGIVVEEISHAFDQYWNADLSYPGGEMSEDATIEELQPLRERAAKFFAERQDVLASYPLQPLNWEKELMSLPSQMHTGEAHFIQDEPVTYGEEEYRLDDTLRYLSNPSHEELIMVTPYLIPGDLLERMDYAYPVSTGCLFSRNLDAPAYKSRPAVRLTR